MVSRMGTAEAAEVLGVSPGATAAEVRAAYLLRARLCHPDKGGDAARFQRLHEAYSVLSAGAGAGPSDGIGTTAPGARPDQEEAAWRQQVASIQASLLLVGNMVRAALRLMLLLQHLARNGGSAAGPPAAAQDPGPRPAAEREEDPGPPAAEREEDPGPGGSPDGARELVHDAQQGCHWLHVSLEDLYHARTLLVCSPQQPGALLRIDLALFRSEYVFPRSGVRVRVALQPHARFVLDEHSQADVHAELSVSPAEYYYGAAVPLQCLDGITRTLRYPGGAGLRRALRLPQLGLPQGGGVDARGDAYVFFVLRMPAIPRHVLLEPTTRAVMHALLGAQTGRGGGDPGAEEGGEEVWDARGEGHG